MSSLSWARVKPVLEKALSAAGPERAAVVATACGGDDELRREVEAYLRYEGCIPPLLPAAQWRTLVPAEDGPPPERVGPWKILREIGNGGMGVVYLAERDDGEYRQTAALKLVRDSHYTETFVDLFRRERQTLAQLNHPNIARLLDGGTTPAGRPYLAMEYVEGKPLGEYCRSRDLPVEGRLRLFVEICRAVSHAHRHLFIHRDLKPDNILVTAGGEPKLLDFGLAKLLDPGTDRQVTMSALPLFTPAYASPEQMRGEELTTASDVYSLGVILYELLAGRSPYDTRGQSFVEVWTAVCERTPQPPSAVERDGRRCRNAADLDAIVLRALRKEPERRYAGADALGEDIERCLARMPVRARQGTAAYYLRRFVARHKWAALGTTAAFLGTCVLLGVILWEQQRAALRFQQLRRFANSVVFELYDSVEALPGSTAARKLLVQRSLEYLRSLEASSGRDLRLKWELAEAYKRVGDAQGNPARANLGDSAGALDSYARARGLLRRILAADAGNLPALNTLAALDASSADILVDRGKPSGALALRREAMDALRQVAARAPTPAARRALALSHYNLAIGLNQAEDWPAATREWRQTLQLYQDIARAQPGNVALARNVALCQKRLASVYLQHGDFAQAIDHYREAEQIDRARMAAEPTNPEAKMDLSFELSDMGLALCGAGRFPEAVIQYESALELRRELAAEDPNDSRAQQAVARSLDRLAVAYESAGRIDRAIESSREATGRLATAQMHDPANQGILKESALGFVHLGRFYRTRAAGRNRAQAEADWRGAVAALERASILSRHRDSAVQLTPAERESLQSIPDSLQACRSKLAPRP